MRHCINCGNKINKNTKFCPYCGTKQPFQDTKIINQDINPNIQSDESTKHYSPKYITKLIGIIIGVIVIIFLCVHMFIWYTTSPISINLPSELSSKQWSVYVTGAKVRRYYPSTHFHKDKTVDDSSYDGDITNDDYNYTGIDTANVRLIPTSKRDCNLIINNHGNKWILPMRAYGSKNVIKLKLNKMKNTTLNNKMVQINGSNITKNGKSINAPKDVKDSVHSSFMLDAE